ncbi:PDDEXK nuclease domain-containing protein [bacterium]|nr:PDDEXK nuclease domain-containing protein [bacterium]
MTHPRREERPDGYRELFIELKNRVRKARVKAALSVNRELVLLYWSIGRDILERQKRLGWGAKVIDQLGADLRQEFPETRGFSGRNLKYMRSFADAWPDESFVQQTAAQIPWFHSCTLLDKVKDHEQRIWYTRKVLENGWSRNVLVMHIERALFEAQGEAKSNFSHTLPSPQSDLARETLKDPYKLDFLGLTDDAAERTIEQGLVGHIRDFLLELGQGFAFVGNQVPLQVGTEEYRLDLLFFHLKLRCFIVVELKTGKFLPEHMGKLNFYLSAVDDLLRHPDDQPSIGLILCKSQEDTVVEYALRGTKQPMAVSQYELTRALPEKLQNQLPSVEELEAELSEANENIDSKAEN